MTIVERNEKLKHFIICLKCEVSGKVCDNNCPTQYNAGNMGEIIENLEAISKALEQEPFKPMVEIDLYSVIKQKYIERDILDKIRAKINKIYNREGNSFDCLNALDELKEFIDKYKGESEV
jgi:hypothetical protein